MELFDLPILFWILTGSFLVGLSKGGVLGVSNITVAVFALIFPPKMSVGLVLMLLMIGDWAAFYFFRRHAVWKYLLPIIPWTIVGVLSGWLLLDRLDEEIVGRLIGYCLLVLVSLHIARSYFLKISGITDLLPHTWWFIGITGLLAGFTSTVANSAAPVMMLFFLAVALPKMEFMGTGAWFFLFLNLFKFPFLWSIEVVTPEVLWFGLKIIPVVLAGAVMGRFILAHIPQKGFELFALAITVLASLQLVL